MSSSMMVGEKKWLTARRSGMTVLGKVAVPKPLNLPSQKLENHGVDPNVEIVPKGTIGWGSSQSPSVPNAWGSSSPKADTGSPSHLNGRPSSGGGTRPSTSGSERTQDPNPSVWGPNSRPSSASGALTSNQTASLLRPHSAETRTGSSQLSRFAEPSPDNSLAWGPNGASNKLGVRPSNNDGFSLSSGDFPTLGAEKDSSGKNVDSQEYGNNSRPGSSSSKTASGKEKNPTTPVGNLKGETANTWTRDGPQHADHGVHPSSDRWQGDMMPPVGNPLRPPHHFEPWNVPPMNHPPHGWYPRGPPYGAPLHPRGGFPMEPFPFYRPRISPNNSKNGEFIRPPHVPEGGYIHPRMQINPGFYPPPYENFYGPPMGHCNPNEHERPFMGMPPGAPVFNRPPYDNNFVDSRFRGKPSAPERMEPRSGHPDDNRGPYKVLLKQSKDRDEKRVGVEREKKDEWGLEDDDQGTNPLDSAKLPENKGNMNLGNESSLSQPSQVLSTSPNTSTLMQKIDGLNIKTRNFDERSEVAALPYREDRYGNRPAAPSRRPSHGAQGRVDHRGKRLNYQDGDGWQKNPLGGESSADISVTNLENNSNVLVCDRPNILEESGKSEFNLQGKDEGDRSMLFFDESENIAQRAKMREIAKQRAEKLQKEEEERTRAQKAKALAKLEELNRRNNISDASIQKLEKAPPSGIAQQQEEKSQKIIESNSDTSKSESSSSAAVRKSKDQIRASNSIMVGENTIVLEKPENVFPKSEVAISEVASQVSDGNISKNKRTEYKQRQMVNAAKNVTEKSIPLTHKNEPILKAGNDVARPENIAVEVASTDSSAHHKRKNNRSSKNKPKMDEVAPVLVLPSTIAKEPNVTKISTEKGKQDTNLAMAKHPVQDLENKLIEENSGKGGHQWKPQQPRHMPRNQQGSNRIGEREKQHGTETVTWAPVRPQEKIELINKPSDKVESGIEATDINLESVVQNNNMKTKRAEMERYIPKPVAKELAQQGSIHQPVVAQKIENTQHGESDAGPAAESKNVDNKHSNPSKSRGPWKQKGHIESALNQGLQEVGKNAQKPIEQKQPLKKSDLISSKEQTTDGWNINDNSEKSAVLSSKRQTTDGWNIDDNTDKSAVIPSKEQTSDGWNFNDYSDKSAVISSKEQTNDGWNINDNSESSDVISLKVQDIKSRGVPGRGNRFPFKGNRNMGNRFEPEHRNTSSGVNFEASSEANFAPETNRMDKPNSLRENRIIGEPTPKWQPKSQMTDKSQINQSQSEPVTVEEARNVDFRRERKPASSRGRPFPPYESDINYGKNDQQFSSGFRKNGNNNNNNRSGRGHEPRGDGPFYRERARQSSQFEYQPVGQYGNNKPNNLDSSSTEGSHNMGPKYRERNQGYPRRGGGNFYDRQSGAAGHGGARYD